MPEQEVHIGKMSIRLPGLDASEGRQLASEVSQILRARLPARGLNRNIGTLEIKVAAPKNNTPTAMAESIVEAILKHLQ